MSKSKKTQAEDKDVIITMSFEGIKKMMQQEAIGFGKWLNENYFLDNNGFYHRDYQEKVHYTEENLYNLYLQSKQQP